MNRLTALFRKIVEDRQSVLILAMVASQLDQIPFEDVDRRGFNHMLR